MSKPSSKIDFDLPPEDFFFIPGKDSGMAPLAPVEWYWRTAPMGRIDGFAISDHPKLNAYSQQIIDHATGSRRFEKAIEYNCVPVMVEDIAFVRNMVRIGGKWVMSGAGGSRVRNRYSWNSKTRTQEDSETLCDAWFSLLQRDDGPIRSMPAQRGPHDDLPYAIEARNLFNYYHFLVETLPRLQHPIDIGHKGPIHIYYKGDKVSGFPMAFIRALFPEIADRVELRQTPDALPRALTDFCFDHYHFVAPERIMPSAAPLVPGNQAWINENATRGAKRMFEMNSYSRDLRRLRLRALNAIRGVDTSHLPKRFWVSRDPDALRNRSMANEDALLRRLKQIGFSEIRFEHLTPLEQIAIMFNAEVMASHHGAGFANMLFAGPDTRVIEIGTPQTAAVRWGDFFQVAHAAQAHYTSFFADHNWDHGDRIPTFADDGHIPVAIGQHGIDIVACYLAAVLDEPATEKDSRTIIETCEMLLTSGDGAKARAVLDTLPATRANQPDILHLYARIADALDEPEAAFAALSALWDSDKSRHGTLEWMIWLCRRIGRTELAPDLVAEHAELFPKRHAAFRKKIRWYQG